MNLADVEPDPCKPLRPQKVYAIDQGRLNDRGLRHSVKQLENIISVLGGSTRVKPTPKPSVTYATVLMDIAGYQKSADRLTVKENHKPATKR